MLISSHLILFKTNIYLKAYHLLFLSYVVFVNFIVYSISIQHLQYSTFNRCWLVPRLFPFLKLCMAQDLCHIRQQPYMPCSPSSIAIILVIFQDVTSLFTCKPQYGLCWFELRKNKMVSCCLVLLLQKRKQVSNPRCWNWV